MGLNSKMQMYKIISRKEYFNNDFDLYKKSNFIITKKKIKIKPTTDKIVVLRKLA